MAVITHPLGSRMQLRLTVGQDDEGNPIYRSRSYSNVKPMASDDDVFAVGNALAGLQQHDLKEVRRINEHILIEE
ncbi:MAG: DUF1659 domain-containing protein [Firmicutes bacterium]|nr:DUF1659 domain-containing protein [Bacillota bacterium]